MKKTRIGGCLLSLFLGATSLALAHHGTSTFDGNTVITLEGRILDFNWANPHSSVEMEVQSTDGRREMYSIEADGPSILRPLGVTRESLKPGDRVIAFVSPSNRSDSNRVLGREIIKGDGTVVALSVAYAREQANDISTRAQSVIGTWVPDQRALFEFVAHRDTWALTEAGEASLEAYDTSEPFSQAECIPATSPTLLVYPTANVLRDEGDVITLDADWMGAVRTIYMDGRPHPPASQRFLQGHSTGHWEGDTLVIDTTNFTDNAIGNAFGIASGARKHLREELSLTADGATLIYSFTLEDPDYLAEPVTGSYRWRYRPDVRASAVECDPEVAGRYLEE